MSRSHSMARLLAGASLTLMAAIGGSAHAADATAEQAPSTSGLTGAGAAGSDVGQVVITAEQNKAAANAPTKASLVETQPEAIISRAFIDQAVVETGQWVDVASFAPGMSGVESNGGGIGEQGTKLTMRGFQDGFFNLTYDGIAFGDTNGPTHHPGSYWPASTIGAVVIDRGPGEAGDLGPANFGGAVHMFSADPSHTFGGTQKLTYGSFDTVQSVTTINSGDIAQLGGGRLYLNLDELSSAGELSYSGGEMFNQLIKYVMPVGDKWTFTLFGDHEYTKFYQPDGGPGETYYQTQAYGKNFALNNNPNDEHYYKFNYERKATDFEYADMKGELFPSITAEDQLYSYFYKNKTWATSSITDPVVGDTGGPTAPNSSDFINNPTGTEKATDLSGYDKLNEYRVYGDIVRLNKDWSWGTLKVGGIYEWSQTDRHNELEDFTCGLAEGGLGKCPDDKFTAAKYTFLPTAPTNYKTMENSAYQNWQVFADFELRPMQNLTITPGIKFVHSTIEVNAADENVACASGATACKNEPLVGSETLSSPLYFLTARYAIRPDLSAYAQVATSFALLGLPDLYYQGANLAQIQPEKTITYQGGVVFSHGDFTADGDVFRVDASNLQVSCTIDDPLPEASTCNAGLARYTGVEGETAYHFDFGLTLFANGDLMSAKQLANAANPAEGIAANAPQELANSPGWTDTVGGIYRAGPWIASLMYNQSGAYVASYAGAIANRMPGYDTLNASGTYNFGRFALKLQASNLLDRRATTAYTGTINLNTATNAQKLADTGLYSYQAGRQIEATIVAKF